MAVWQPEIWMFIGVAMITVRVNAVNDAQNVRLDTAYRRITDQKNV